MGKSDIQSKDLLQWNEYFADTVNYMLFDGNQVVIPEELKELDTTELTIVDDVVKESVFIQKYRDVLKRAIIRVDKKAIYAIVGIEGQTDIHYALPVKESLYDAIRYAKQVEKASASLKKESEGEKISGAEFLSGFRKNDKILPIITITVYFGTKEWDGPLSLHKMFDEAIDENVLSLIPDYKVHLLEPTKITDWSRFKSDIGILYQLISVSNLKNGVKNVIESDKDRFRNVDNKVVRAVNFYTNTTLPVDEERGVTDMCYAMETFKEEAIAEGIKQGIEQGIEQGRELQREEDTRIIASLKERIEELESKINND
ncbi:MAG: transposase [Lachnospiraceae bacterium]|nr:transposase [Lachnospiraceae bacterium]